MNLPRNRQEPLIAEASVVESSAAQAQMTWIMVLWRISLSGTICPTRMRTWPMFTSWMSAKATHSSFLVNVWTSSHLTTPSIKCYQTSQIIRTTRISWLVAVCLGVAPMLVEASLVAIVSERLAMAFKICWCRMIVPTQSMRAAPSSLRALAKGRVAQRCQSFDSRSVALGLMNSNLIVRWASLGPGAFKMSSKTMKIACQTMQKAALFCRSTQIESMRAALGKHSFPWKMAVTNSWTLPMIRWGAARRRNYLFDKTTSF